MQDIRDKIIKLIDDAISSAANDGFKRGYHQGASDTKQELLKLLGSGVRVVGADDSDDGNSEESPGESRDKEQESPYAETEKPASERQRAPRGLVPIFVKRVLKENPGGLTPNDFAQFACDEFEEMIKLPSVRSELNKGRSNGRYKEIGGVWYLVDDSENEEAESLI